MVSAGRKIPGGGAKGWFGSNDHPHFDREVIILCVRWYLRFKLSLRDLVEMMAERGLSLVHTTIMRWVQHYTPEFEKRWRRYALPIGRSWRVDETYVRIRGEWCYLYRAVDRAGRTIDFRLSTRRDVAAAKAFFRKAMKSQQCAPQTITLDGYAASHRAVRELKADGSLPMDTKLRSSKYLNNLEQDHRSVKQRIAVMLGLKQFHNAAITIAGIELMHRIHKGQFGLRRLGAQGRAAPAVAPGLKVVGHSGYARARAADLHRNPSWRVPMDRELGPGEVQVRPCPEGGASGRARRRPYRPHARSARPRRPRSR